MKRALVIIQLLVILFSCQKEINTPTTPSAPQLATITTTNISSLTATTAASGGNISSNGGALVTARGVCWSLTAHPTVADHYTIDGSGDGTFTSALTGLTPLTTYYIRAYAANGAGMAYGNELSFTTTNVANALPTLSTTTPSSVTTTSAATGGNVSNDGGATITARGICWSTLPNPSIAGSHTSDGNGAGIFVSNLTALNAATTYYIRAFATNTVGTAYGNELTFTTLTSITVPTITTNTVIAINSMSATSGGNISTDGGSAVTARGICWSTSPNPGVSANHTTNGTGMGSFTSDMTGLTPTTTYYVRAYATNTIGTAYGNQQTFTTSTADVYVAGYTSNGSHTIATIWKNGVASPLTDGTNDAMLRSVFVSGNDVYAAGYEKNGTQSIAKYWKNGVSTSLLMSNGSNASDVNSIFISGTDVYACGQKTIGTNDNPVLWKNAVQQSFYSNGGYAHSVFVSGSNVYVGGTNYNISTSVTSLATIWQNGTPTSLTGGGPNGGVFSVCVSGNHVYACGNESSVAKFWLDGYVTSLTSGVGDAAALSIFVSGNDFYIAGYEKVGTYFAPRLWKNGAMVPLPAPVYNCWANSVYVSGTDVYVAGFESPPTGNAIAKLWKNGVVTNLTDGTAIASAQSVFVK